MYGSGSPRHLGLGIAAAAAVTPLAGAFTNSAAGMGAAAGALGLAVTGYSMRSAAKWEKLQRQREGERSRTAEFTRDPSGPPPEDQIGPTRQQIKNAFPHLDL